MSIYATLWTIQIQNPASPFTSPKQMTFIDFLWFSAPILRS